MFFADGIVQLTIILIHNDFSLEIPNPNVKEIYFAVNAVRMPKEIFLYGYIGMTAALFVQMTFNTCVWKISFQVRTLDAHTGIARTLKRNNCVDSVKHVQKSSF